MILKEFPNIEWLRQQAKTSFADRQGYQDLHLEKKGWPSVVLNTTSAHTERENILGPFSVFVNLAGNSLIRTERRDFAVGEDTYCITNSRQTYDLIIPKNSSATTFNIHFGTQLFEETIYVLSHNHDFLLDNPTPFKKIPFSTFPRSAWKDDNFQFWIEECTRFYDQVCSHDGKVEEEMLSEFLAYILSENSRELKTMHAISSQKISTRKELMKRILKAIDFIHESYSSQISLDQLSEVSNLSKFHLQRTFKQVKGCTPHQYISQIRLKKSLQLLKNPELSFSQIAFEVGFSEISAFSRFFANQLKISPTQYRNQISNMGQMEYFQTI